MIYKEWHFKWNQVQISRFLRLVSRCNQKPLPQISGGVPLPLKKGGAQKKDALSRLVGTVHKSRSSKKKTRGVHTKLL